MEDRPGQHYGGRRREEGFGRTGIRSGYF
jgi:hypothetical protein